MSALTTEAVVANVSDSERRHVRALVFKVDESTAATLASKAVDPFEGLRDDLVAPPVDLLKLAKLSSMSAELGPAVEAMETNIEGFGYQFLPRVDVNRATTSEAVREAVADEARALRNTFKTICRGRSRRITFTALRRRTRRDLELTGNAFWECLRGRTRKLVAFNHIPSHQIRIVNVEPKRVEARVKYLEEQVDGTYAIATYTDFVCFKKFVQGSVFGATSERRYFKEFGDPRTLDSQTGRYVPDAEAASDFEGSKKPMPEERKAGELIHFAIYCPWTPYGMPRWYGAMLGLLGARNAEEINWVTLKNNNIPSMMLCVSNGRLTEATIERVQQFVDTHIKGSQNYSQLLLLEGESGADNDTTNQVKIDVKPLIQAQHTDELFSKYIAGRNEDVRRQFRFSGIFTGHTDNLNKSLAHEARKLGDEQVFAPERDEFDEFMSETVFPELGIVHHTFKSKTPNITDNAELISMMAIAERVGAMTPERGDLVVKDVFPGVDRFPLDPEVIDLKRPWSAQMAELIKNQAQATEVGQQVAPVQPSINEPLGRGTSDLQTGVEKADEVGQALDLAERLALEVRRALGTL